MVVSVVSGPGDEYLNRRFTTMGKKQLGIFLRACRLSHGWTLEDLVEKTRSHETEIYRRKGKTSEKPLGVALSNISRYETGNYERPTLDQLWILLDVLRPINPNTGKLMHLEELLMIGTEESSLNLDAASQSNDAA